MAITFRYGANAVRQFLDSLQPVSSTLELWIKVGNDNFYKTLWDGSDLILRRSWKEDEDDTYSRVVSPDAISNGIDYLLKLSREQSGGVFFVPTQPQGLPLAECVAATDDIGIESDHITKDAQLAQYREYEQVSGISFHSILSSGGKSDHGHIKTDRAYPVEVMNYIRRLAIIAFTSDPVTERLHQPMRLPGFYRAEKGNWQELIELNPDARYTPDELLEGFRRWFTHRGWVLPAAVPADWFSECFQRIYRSGSGLTPEQKVEKTRELLEVGPEAWQQQREAEAKAAAERRRLNRARIEISGQFDLAEAIKRVNESATVDDFNFVGANWQGNGSKYRGPCAFHQSQSGTGAWVDTKAGITLYHCYACTNNKGLSLFDFEYRKSIGWSGGSSNPRLTGKDFVDFAKGFLADHGVTVPEYQPSNQVEPSREDPTHPQYTETQKAAYKAQKQAERKKQYKLDTEAEQAYYSRLDIEPTHELSGEFIPKGWIQLPDKPGIVVIDAPMKSSKTHTGFKDLVDAHRAVEPNAVRAYMTNRNNLCLQSGKKLVCPFHKNIPNFSVENNKDFSGCFESGPSKFNPELMPKYNPSNHQGNFIDGSTVVENKPLMIIDEPSQVFEQVLFGGTSKSNHPAVLRRTRELLKYVADNNGWIVMAEDGVTNLEVDIVKAATGLEVVAYYKFNKVEENPEKRVYTISTKSPTAVWERLETILGKNAKARVWIATDSKDFAEDLAKKLENMGYPNESILLATSETSETPEVKAFAENPDNHLTQFVIASPTFQSGISCDDPTGYFDELLFCITSMPARTAKQLPERLRTDVPRFGYVAEYSLRDDEECSSSRASVILSNKLRVGKDVMELVKMAEWYQANDPYLDSEGNPLDLVDTLAKIKSELEDVNTPTGWAHQFAAKYKARENWGKQHIREDYEAYLNSRGFTVLPDATYSEAQKEERQKCREAIDNAHAEEFAALEVPPDMTLEDARNTLNKGDAKREDRLIATKLIYSDKYPDVPMDDPGFVLRAFIKDRGEFVKATELLWKAQNPDKAIWLDRWIWHSAFTSAAFSGSDVWIFNLSNHSVKAKLLSEAPLEPFLSGSVRKWDGSTQAAKDLHRWAYERRWDLKRHLNLNIPDPVTEVNPDKPAAKLNAHKVANKILKRLGFNVDAERLGNGERKWVYFISDLEDKDRQVILNALSVRFDTRFKAKTESTSKTCSDNDISTQQKLDAENNDPINLEEDVPVVPDIYRYSDWTCPVKKVGTEEKTGLPIIEAIDPTRRTTTAQWAELRPWDPADIPQPLEVPAGAYRRPEPPVRDGYESF